MMAIHVALRKLLNFHFQTFNCHWVRGDQQQSQFSASTNNYRIHEYYSAKLSKQTLIKTAYVHCYIDCRQCHSKRPSVFPNAIANAILCECILTKK